MKRRTCARIFNKTTGIYRFSVYYWNNGNLVDHTVITDENAELAHEYFCGKDHTVIRDKIYKYWLHDLTGTNDLIIIE